MPWLHNGSHWEFSFRSDYLFVFLGIAYNYCWLVGNILFVNRSKLQGSFLISLFKYITNSTTVIAKRCRVIILRYIMLRHNELWHNVKKSVRLKHKIMSITCRFHVFDLVFSVVQQGTAFIDWPNLFFYRRKLSALFYCCGKIHIKNLFSWNLQNNLLCVEMLFKI